MQDYTLGQLEQNSKLRARQLCKTLSQLGPSFVKIGQALSSRPDLLPQIYLEVSAPCFCAKAVGLCSVEHWLLPSASPKWFFTTGCLLCSQRNGYSVCISNILCALSGL